MDCPYGHGPLKETSRVAHAQLPQEAYQAIQNNPKLSADAKPVEEGKLRAKLPTAAHLKMEGGSIGIVVSCTGDCAKCKASYAWQEGVRLLP